MPYIYKITNKINNKVYIGKTINSIETRWKEHCNDFQKKRCEKRPLYEAMKKYGVENFRIEEVESCDIEVLNERETFWIEFFGSFKNGYNATRGGDGKVYADYDLIYKLYQQFGTIHKVSALTGYSKETIASALECNGVDKQTRQENATKAISKPVAKYDLKTGEIIKIYPSAAEAERDNGNTKHINEVCKGKRKSCKGFGWRYV
jgi:group I intron endonuclease